MQGRTSDRHIHTLFPAPDGSCTKLRTTGMHSMTSSAQASWTWFWDVLSTVSDHGGELVLSLF